MDGGNVRNVEIDKVGAANPYNLFGDANGEITLAPDARAVLYFAAGLPDVAGGAKEIDVSSSDVDAKYDIIMAAG